MISTSIGTKMPPPPIPPTHPKDPPTNATIVPIAKGQFNSKFYNNTTFFTSTFISDNMVCGIQ